MLLRRIKTTTIYKVQAHAIIEGNEQADKLAKEAINYTIKMPNTPTYTTTLHFVTFKRIGGILWTKYLIVASLTF